ncbi:nucleoporin NDC1-like isoform X1 [Xenopus laevis]|nr:nucleoporin NDC1-like isoform X1 [Xenopus laevis]
MTMLGERQVLRWRVASSLAWSVILLPVACAVFLVLSHIHILHPIQWLTDSISDLTSSYTIFCLLLISTILGLQCTFLMEYYTVVPSIPCSRLALIGNILLPHRILHSLAHVVMGVLASWCCAVMSKGKYQLLVVSCTSLQSEDEADRTFLCLNESHLFQLLCGAFFGYSYSLQYFVHNMNFLSFPSIQQYKYLQFRRCLPLIIKQSGLQALYFIRNYAVLYYFLGNIPRTWIQTSLNLHMDRQQPSLDTLRGLLNVSLFYQTWLSATFLLATWYMIWILFRIYTTEARIFPVQTSFTEEAEKCLPFILNSNTLPLVKYLAMQDLVLLSQYSPSRRQEVFSLSQPGGHPHNWIAISKECLNLLSSLTSRLVAHQEAAASNGRIRVPSSPKQTRKSSSSSGASLIEDSAEQTQNLNIIPRAGIPSLLKTTSLKSSLDTGSPFTTPGVKRVSESLDPNSPWHGSVQSPHVMRRGAKLWTSDSGVQRNGSEVSSLSPVTLSPACNGAKQGILYMCFQHKLDQIKNFLSKRGLLIYLFSKHPEASSQDVFADAQIHIWALEALSHLVAASFSEDRMGVVQTSLSNILATFFTLQEAVEKHFKLPHASSKPARNPGSLLDCSYKTLRFSLRAALKTAIYRMTTTFGEHLHAVPVSSEHQKKLQQFLDFKE